MFDDPIPPSNLPTDKKEPEDIFDKVEPAASSPSAYSSTMTPGSAMPTPPSPEGAVEVKQPLVSSKKVIIVVGIIVGVLVVAGAGFAAFRFIKRTATPPTASTSDILGPEEAAQTPTPEIPSLPAPLPTPSEEVPPEETVVTETPPAQQPSTPPAEPVASADADGDGLTDSQEATYGTDPQNPDSDNDGLFDGEEVQTYETNPLNSDTDGDTYLDGQEVRSGYNPKGNGRLFSVPAQ